MNHFSAPPLQRKDTCHLIDSGERYFFVILCRLLCTPEIKVDRGGGGEAGPDPSAPLSEPSLT